MRMIDSSLSFIEPSRVVRTVHDYVLTNSFRLVSKRLRLLAWFEAFAVALSVAALEEAFVCTDLVK